jgi:glycosyltransferase involved in cell wall biosynthesis
MIILESNTAPIKIAIIGSRGYPFVYSGYETLIKELSERLVAKKGCEVTVYCHRYLFKKKPALVNGIKLVYVPTIESKSLSQLIHSFLSMCHAVTSDADVIFAVNTANGPFGLISKIFRKPTAINVDGLEWLRPKWKGLGAKYFKIAARLSTILFDQIINDSDEMRKVYLNMFKKDSVVIAYGAKVTKSEDHSLIKQWLIKPKEYYLVVGRMIPDNNGDVIIKGFLASNSTKKMVVVGDVFYKDNYADSLKAIKDERLIFTGYVNDPKVLRALYHHCYVYVHGHEFGGTNPTMIKAMAYGCAILALDTVFNKEMLDNDSYGIYFDKNQDAVRHQINYADEHPNKIEKFRQNSHFGITDKYNWDCITDQYLEVFRHLTKK